MKNTEAHPLKKDKGRMFYCCHFFSLWPFKRTAGAQEPPLSAFIKMKPRQLQLAPSEAAASGVLGLLHPPWNVDGIWVQPVQG